MNKWLKCGINKTWKVKLRNNPNSQDTVPVSFPGTIRTDSYTFDYLEFIKLLQVKYKLLAPVLAVILFSCNAEKSENESKAASNPMIGSWKMFEGASIQNGDTTITDYTRGLSFIKILNETHFAFFNHDLNKGKDTAAASFVAGGGAYTFKDSTYTEHLDYCSARDWEGHIFSFTVTIKNDTLVQYGREKAEGAGVDRVIIEKYVRVKE